MEFAPPAESRDSVSRALIDAQGREIARLRARVAELEETCERLREELRRAGLPRITEAWD